VHRNQKYQLTYAFPFWSEKYPNVDSAKPANTNKLLVMDRALWVNLTKTGYEHGPRTCWHYSLDFNKVLVTVITGRCMPSSGIRSSVLREQEKAKKKEKNRD
jgi:hypothetical protein